MLLPTPSAEHNDGQNPERFLARRERIKAQGINGNGFGLTLGMAVRLLPTPTASGDARNTRPTSDYHSLAGELARLRGEPTSP